MSEGCCLRSPATSFRRRRRRRWRRHRRCRLHCRPWTGSRFRHLHFHAAAGLHIGAAATGCASHALLLPRLSHPAHAHCSQCPNLPWRGYGCASRRRSCCAWSSRTRLRRDRHDGGPANCHGDDDGAPTVRSSSCSSRTRRPSLCPAPCEAAAVPARPVPAIVIEAITAAFVHVDAAPPPDRRDRSRCRSLY